MVRKIAVLVAGLLLLIPTSAFASNDEREMRGVVLTTGDAELGAVGDEAVPAFYAPIDVPARETGRELHEQ
jgi:hypothetical protein